MPANAAPPGNADVARAHSPQDEDVISPHECCWAQKPAPGPASPAKFTRHGDDTWQPQVGEPDPDLSDLAESGGRADDGSQPQGADPDLDVGLLAELDPLSDEDWQALTGPPPPQPPRTAWPEGIVPPNGFLSPPPTTGGPGFGFGFGEGDPLDLAAAGLALAGFADDAHTALSSMTA